jgi:hypothetical protein
VSDTPPPLRRLDPERALTEPAAGEAPPAEPPSSAPPPSGFDTRRYRWAIGIFGLALVIGLSVYGFARNGVGSPGVTAGKPLHRFVAPLATGPLVGDVNTHPRCDPARPLAGALNVCNRRPTVVAFFVTGQASCEREVDALQSVSRTGPAGTLFAAVAVHSGRASTLRAVRRHHWTIPVAYDRDGGLGGLYGVEICPMVEIAQANGIVGRRLIGDHWTAPAALAGQVRAGLG